MTQQTTFTSFPPAGTTTHPTGHPAPLRFAPVLSSAAADTASGPTVASTVRVPSQEPRIGTNHESMTWQALPPTMPPVAQPVQTSPATAVKAPSSPVPTAPVPFATVPIAPAPIPVSMGQRHALPAGIVQITTPVPVPTRTPVPVPAPIPVMVPVPMARRQPVSPGSSLAPTASATATIDSRHRVSSRSSRSGSHRKSRSKRSTVAGRRVHWLALGYLLLTMSVARGIELISEGWWLTAAIVYAPRMAWLIPALFIVPACLRWNPRMTPIAIVAALFAAGPIMGYRTAGYFSASPPAPGAIRAVSCNVHGFEPDFPAQIGEIGGIDPELVAFQEVFNDHPLRVKHFAGWQTIRKDEYLISAKHPLVLLGECESPAFHRIAAIAARVEDPAGPYVVVNIHLTTARFGLMKLNPATVIGKNGIQQLSSYISDREEEALAVRRWAEEVRGDLPLVCLGDFNMPVDSSIHGACFGDLLNTFDHVGVGYGYTAPNQTSTWPRHNPWLRVDHILVSHGDWEVHQAWTGRANGSDHKLVGAIFSRHDGRKY
jgi:endonuclease/exonuclease/phosphatase family metal-dependent hydrolase